MEGRYKRRKAAMVIIFGRLTRRPHDHSFIRSLEPIYYDQGLRGAGRSTAGCSSWPAVSRSHSLHKIIRIIR